MKFFELKMRLIPPLVVFCCLACVGSQVAQAQTPTVINFEQFTGPSGFSGIQPPLTVGIATFSGGQILSNTSGLPADETTVYGTSFFCSGCLSTITIDFAQPVSNLSVFLANGQTFNVMYTVQDDLGGTQNITLVANFSSGAGTVTLPSTGIRRVTVTSNTAQWDFFIDNVTFTSATQTQTSPPQTFSSTGNTTVTVPFIFNQNQGTYDEQDEMFTQNGDLTCPIGCDQIEVQNTATPISNDPVWSTFVGGTPFGPSKLFPHASNGGTDIGTMYTIECFNSANPPKPGQCPFPTNPGPGNHVNAKEIFDLPVGVPPTIAFGTTVGGLHFPPGTIAMPNPQWSSSNMLPNPACKNVLTATFDCPLENTAVTKYGKANKIDKDTKNGSYAVAYGVPMLCSAWKVNGVPVNTPPGCAQNPSSSTFFVRSPLTFDFLVTPAQLPAGFTIEQIASIQRTGSTVTVTTTSQLPVAWTSGTTLAIKPDDKVNFPPVSAVISKLTGTQFSYTQTGPTVTDNSATGTVDDANGFVAAPVDKLFYHIDPCTSPVGDPCSNAPDYPNSVLLTNDENLNDLDNCPGTADQFGNPCVVAGTVQPGTSSTQAVEFSTTVPVSATVLPEGLYKLQVAAKDTVNTSEMNIQLLTDPLAQCPDPSPTDANRIPNAPPGQGWQPPCYSTTLFYAKIGVDNTAPVVGCPTAPATWSAGTSLTLNCTAYDALSGLQAPTSAASCPTGAPACTISIPLTATIPVGTETAAAFTTPNVSVVDLAGNAATAGPITNIKLDNKPPTITVTSPANLATYNANLVVNANYGCTDLGSGVATCAGPVPSGTKIDTMPTGFPGISTPKSFTVNSTDKVANASSLTVNYSVSCHYVAFAINPTTVSRGGRVNVTASVMDCTSSSQKISLKFSLTGPLGRSCGITKTVMFTTPYFTVPAGTSQVFTFPIFIPWNACTGTFTTTTTTFISGTQVDSTSVTLNVH